MKIFLSLLTLLSFYHPSTYAISSFENIKNILNHQYDHIDKKIEEAKVELNPFPHILIEGVFTDELYKNMHRLWPKSQEFIGDNRSILPVTYGCLECTGLTTEQKIFWRMFGEVIVNRYIKQKLILKLAPYICLKHRLGDFSSQDLTYLTDFTNLRQDCLVQDLGSYQISPHIDQLNIFAALLFYLPEDFDHQEFGTELLSGQPCENPNEIYEGHEMLLVRKIPYKPNTLLCFLQTPSSWHRVSPIKDRKGYIRKLYLAPIFLSPEFVSRHYQDIYDRSIEDEYYFDHRFLSKKNWKNIWGKEDLYK